MVLITSALPGEGKTTLAANLAISLADIGRQILLIDGDLRRPRLHQIFDIANTWGLSDLLCEKDEILELPLDRLTRPTSIPNLRLLPSGPGSDRIFQCLCSTKTSRLLLRFRDEFDYVLIDAPPCLEFADARILARNADAAVLVFRADRTPSETAQEATERLASDRIPVLGTVLNGWDPRAGTGRSDHADRMPRRVWEDARDSILA